MIVKGFEVNFSMKLEVKQDQLKPNAKAILKPQRIPQKNDTCFKKKQGGSDLPKKKTLSNKRIVNYAKRKHYPN